MGDPWADTTITVLGGLAEFERHLILSRINEGRQRAMANGIKFGRMRKLTKHQRDEALAAKRWGAFGRYRQELQRQSLNDFEAPRA